MKEIVNTGTFMATNIEKRFFEPDFEEKYLNVYELRGWPSLMEGKVNRCCDDYGCLLPLEKIPADALWTNRYRKV